MKLKGNYDSGGSYSIGDIVVFDGEVYIKQREGEMPGSPKDPHIWGRLHQSLAEAVLLIMDALDLAQDNLEKYFINDQTLVLSTETSKYAVTVDDSGDSPELAVEAIEEEE